MTEQGAGGYSVVVCHECKQPVACDNGAWLHLDDTPFDTCVSAIDALREKQ
jgi:hypothetical protein